MAWRTSGNATPRRGARSATWMSGSGVISAGRWSTSTARRFANQTVCPQALRRSQVVLLGVLVDLAVRRLDRLHRRADRRNRMISLTVAGRRRRHQPPRGGQLCTRRLLATRRVAVRSTSNTISPPVLAVDLRRLNAASIRSTASLHWAVPADSACSRSRPQRGWR